MADQNSDQEKTEEPTARKIRKAREEGNVSKSAEVSSAALLTAGFLGMYMLGSFFLAQTEYLFLEFFTDFSQPLNNTNNALYFSGIALRFALMLAAPIITILMVIALASNLLQVGIVFSSKVISMKPNRLNPLTGLKRLFSLKGFVELVKGIAKIVLVGIVIYYTMRGEVDGMLDLVVLPLGAILSKTGYWIALLVSRILATLIILSIADAAYQRFQYRKDLRMTKQEVKDEYKQMEGDPQVKSNRRKQAVKLAHRRRLDHAVLNSDVVVTNPTHYAVALRYTPGEHDAPIVMAKGMRLRALKIREYAEKYDIPIIENPPVARALYASAEEEQHVPPELYQAVAEILAYVYRIKNQNAA